MIPSQREGIIKYSQKHQKQIKSHKFTDSYYWKSSSFFFFDSIGSDRHIFLLPLTTLFLKKADRPTDGGGSVKIKIKQESTESHLS